MTFVITAFALCHLLIRSYFEILILAECASKEVRVKVLVFFAEVIYKRRITYAIPK